MYARLKFIGGRLVIRVTKKPRLKLIINHF